jgi:uncharacterized membrane protein HdeD (DUF308 family)
MSSDSQAFAMETKSMPWWLILIEGISAIVIGILLFTSTASTLNVLVIFLGLYWLVKGIFDLVSMFVDHSMWGWKLFIGVIGIAAGLVILRHPIVSTAAIPVIFAWILGFYSILAGIVMLIQAFKGGGWGAGIMGVIGIILGILVLGNTIAAAIIFVYLGAATLIVGGIAAVIFAFRARS